MTDITHAAKLNHSLHRAHKHTAPATSHACFHCQHAGQPVEPDVLTLKATALTPPDWPQQVRVQTYVCVDTAACKRRTLTYAVSDQIH
jgi:hypothetical protein